jgi:hypothetical protein
MSDLIDKIKDIYAAFGRGSGLRAYDPWRARPLRSRRSETRAPDELIG